MRHSFYQQVPLVPLGTGAIRELLVDLLGDDPSLESLPERIHKHTAGNPFFIEEVAQTLVENGSRALDLNAEVLSHPPVSR